MSSPNDNNKVEKQFVHETIQTTTHVEEAPRKFNFVKRELAGCIGKESDKTTLCGIILTGLSVLFAVITFPISLLFILMVVREYERVVVFRLGKVLSGKPKGPGVIFVLACVDSFVRVDLRTVSFDVPPQEVLTKDAVTVSVDAVIYYKVVDPLGATITVLNYGASTRLLSSTTLRNVIGTRDLSELLSDREGISQTIQANLEAATTPWGVQVERVEIRDVRIPVKMQRSMAREAEACREAKAKIITAQGEIKASKALVAASNNMVGNPTSLQLRYLQSLNSISSDQTSTLIFPFPIDLIRQFLKR